MVAEQVPIAELAQILSLKRKGKYLHCWHPEKHSDGDRTPSVGIDVRRNKVHCFACHFDYSPIDLVMDVKQMTAREAAQWLASIWTGAGQVEQQYEVRERLKRVGPWPSLERKLTHEWSKLKPKEIKKREKGYVERIIGSPLWSELTPAAAKVMLTLLTLTDPKTLTATISTRELANLVGIRRSAVIRATRAIEKLGMYASDTSYDKLSQKNKTKTYRLTWHSQAWQAWLRGKTRNTSKATCVTVSQTDHPVSPESASPVAALSRG